MDLRLIYRHYYFENTWKYWQTGYLGAAAATTDTGGDGFEGEGKWNRKYRLEDVIKPNQFPWDYNHWLSQTQKLFPSHNIGFMDLRLNLKLEQ